MAEVGNWLSQQARAHNVWYIKRLSANDTLATGSHQAGPYIPKKLLFEVFPSIHDDQQRNPRVTVPAVLDSHPQQREAAVSVIWYNARVYAGPTGEPSGHTRNEARITGWGGRQSPLLDPESTGAIAIIVFEREGKQATGLRVWVCTCPEEEQLLEERLGQTVEPGAAIVRRIADIAEQNAPSEIEPPGRDRCCRLDRNDLPLTWQGAFPTGREIVSKTLELRPLAGSLVDQRLIERRDCEFELFQSVEEAIEAPLVQAGYPNLPAFLQHAQSVLQRRKTRAGRSLELQLQAILLEEGMREGQSFAYQPESDPGKRPDFLFPSEAAYKDPAFDAAKLTLLAVKTTCRDRWRQVINEADRIPTKHLLTLQEGVSETQFGEMENAGIRLVVPRSLHGRFPKSIQPRLLGVDDFIQLLRDRGV